MRERIAWGRVAVLAAMLVGAPMSAVSAQSAAPGAAGELIGQFTAHLRGTQTEHYSSLWNVSYDPDDGGCKPGFMSHSTDQRMTFESEPVEVDAVRLPPGTQGWAGQDYVLVPRGMGADMVTWAAPGSELYLAPVLFELPIDVTIYKSYADPATGQGPAEPLPFVVACTGGDGPGGSPPPLDCGQRTFSSTMAVLQPEVNVAIAAASDSVFSGEPEQLYQNCPTSIDAVPGGFVWGEEVPPAHTGGPLPTVEQLLDPGLTAVDIIGQVSGGYQDTGYLASQALDWTLTLCRQGATAPTC
jgi:hypothetical protein